MMARKIIPDVFSWCEQSQDEDAADGDEDAADGDAQVEQSHGSAHASDGDSRDDSDAMSEGSSRGDSDAVSEEDDEDCMWCSLVWYSCNREG